MNALETPGAGMTLGPKGQSSRSQSWKRAGRGLHSLDVCSDIVGYITQFVCAVLLLL